MFILIKVLLEFPLARIGDKIVALAVVKCLEITSFCVVTLIISSIVRRSDGVIWESTAPDYPRGASDYKVEPSYWYKT